MASYFTEGQVLVQYAIKKLSARRIAIVYQNDSFGKGALAGARSVFSKNKFKSFIEIPYSQKSFSFKDGIEKILSYKPDAIIFFSTAMAAIAFIRQIDAKNLIGKHILGISDLAESTFKNFIEEKGLKPIITQSYPNVKTSDLEIIKEYREDTKRQGASIDPIPLQAYVGGSLLVDILKKIEGEVTKEKIMEKIEALQDYDFKGLKLNFDPQTRELRNDVWIDTGASNWEHWEMDKS